MKRYSINLLLAIFITLGFIAGFNWYVNPFDIFDAPVVNGFNEHKALVGRYSRLSKPYQVELVKPDYIVLGSSRALEIPVDYGVEKGLKGYNLALASGSMYELWRMYQHANEANKLKQVVIGVDEVFTNELQQDFDEQRLSVMPDGKHNIGKLKSYLRDVFSSLLSLDALRTSLSTIKKQPDVDIEEFLANEKRRRVRDAGGHWEMFHKLEAGVLAGFSVKQAENCERSTDAELDNSAQYFRKLVQQSYANNTELLVFFSPVHARLYETWCVAGHWNDIEKTKRQVVEVVYDEAKKANLDPFAIWDFAGYNSVTTEALTSQGDKESIMRYYWEGSHYTEETARYILDRLAGKKANVPDDFGVKLTPGNLEKHLEQIYQQHISYMKNNPETIQDIRGLIK